MNLIGYLKKIAAMVVAVSMILSPNQFGFAQDTNQDFTQVNGQSVPAVDAEKSNSKTVDDFDFGLGNQNQAADETISPLSAVSPAPSNTQVARNTVLDEMRSARAAETGMSPQSSELSSEASFLEAEMPDNVAKEETDSFTTYKWTSTNNSTTTFSYSVSKTSPAETSLTVNGDWTINQSGRLGAKAITVNGNLYVNGQLQLGSNSLTVTGSFNVAADGRVDAGTGSIMMGSGSINAGGDLNVGGSVQGTIDSTVMGTIHAIVPVDEANMPAETAIDSASLIDARQNSLNTIRANHPNAYIQENGDGTFVAIDGSVSSYYNSDGSFNRSEGGAIDDYQYMNLPDPVSEPVPEPVTDTASQTIEVTGEEQEQASSILDINKETYPTLYKITSINYECDASPCGNNAIDNYYGADGVFLGSRQYDSTVDSSTALITSVWFDVIGNIIQQKDTAWEEEKQIAASILAVDSNLIDRKMTAAQPVCFGPGCASSSTLTQYFDKAGNMLGSKEENVYTSNINVVWRNANGNIIGGNKELVGYAMNYWNDRQEWFGANDETLSVDDRKVKPVIEMNLGNTGIVLNNNAGTLNYDPNTKTAVITAPNGSVTEHKNVVLFNVGSTHCTVVGCDTIMASLPENMRNPKQIASFTRQKNLDDGSTLVSQMIVYVNEPIMRGEDVPAELAEKALKILGQAPKFMRSYATATPCAVGSDGSTSGCTDTVDHQFFIIDENNQEVFIGGVSYTSVDGKTSEGWRDANNSPIDIPASDPVSREEAANAAASLKLASADLIVSKQVEVYDSFCLSLDCPIAGNSTKYFDANGKLLGSKTELTYRDYSVSLIAEGQATGDNFEKTFTTTTWYDASGKEIKQADASLPQAVALYIQALNNQFAKDRSRVNASLQADGTYLVTIDRSFQCPEGMMCEMVAPAPGSFGSISFSLNADGTRKEGSMSADYNGIMVTGRDADTLFEAMNVCPQGEYCADSFRGPTDAETFAKMTQINVTNTADGAIFFTKNETEYRAYRAKDGVIVEIGKNHTLTAEQQKLLDRVNDHGFDFDFNGDGKFTWDDYSLFKSFDGDDVSDLTRYLNSEAKQRLDLNQDGKIDPEDVSAFGSRLKGPVSDAAKQSVLAIFGRMPAYSATLGFYGNHPMVVGWVSPSVTSYFDEQGNLIGISRTGGMSKAVAWQNADGSEIKFQTSITYGGIAENIFGQMPAYQLLRKEPDCRGEICPSVMPTHTYHFFNQNFEVIGSYTEEFGTWVDAKGTQLAQQLPLDNSDKDAAILGGNPFWKIENADKSTTTYFDADGKLLGTKTVLTSADSITVTTLRDANDVMRQTTTFILGNATRPTTTTTTDQAGRQTYYEYKIGSIVKSTITTTYPDNTSEEYSRRIDRDYSDAGAVIFERDSSFTYAEVNGVKTKVEKYREFDLLSDFIMDVTWNQSIRPNGADYELDSELVIMSDASGRELSKTLTTHYPNQKSYSEATDYAQDGTVARKEISDISYDGKWNILNKIVTVETPELRTEKRSQYFLPSDMVKEHVIEKQSDGKLILENITIKRTEQNGDKLRIEINLMTSIIVIHLFTADGNNSSGYTGFGVRADHPLLANLSAATSLEEFTKTTVVLSKGSGAAGKSITNHFFRKDDGSWSETPLYRYVIENLQTGRYFLVVGDADSNPGTGDDIELNVTPNNLRLENRDAIVSWSFPVISGETGLQPFGVVIYDMGKNTFVEYPKQTQVELNGIKYNIKIVNNGMVTLEEAIKKITISDEENAAVEALFGTKAAYKTENEDKSVTSYFDADGKLLGTKTTLKPAAATTVTTWRGTQGNTKKIETVSIYPDYTVTTVQDSLGRTTLIKMVFNNSLEFGGNKTATTEMFYENAANPSMWTRSVNSSYNDEGDLIALYNQFLRFSDDGQQTNTQVGYFTNQGRKIYSFQSSIINNTGTTVYFGQSLTADYSGKINGTSEISQIADLADYKLIITDTVDTVSRQYVFKDESGHWIENYSIIQNEMDQFLLVGADKIKLTGRNPLAAAGDKTFQTWFQFPQHGFKADGSYGLLPLGFYVQGQSETVFVEFPKNKTVTLDGKDYEIEIDAEGTMTLVEIPLNQLEAFRKDLLERLDNDLKTNQAALASLLAELEEAKANAAANAAAFEVEVNDLEASLKDLMTQMQAIVDSDLMQTLDVQAIAAKLAEMRGFLENDFENQKINFKNYILTRMQAWFEKNISAHQSLLKMLSAHQELVMQAATLDALKKLSDEYPQPAPELYLGEMSAMMVLDPRAALRNFMEEGRALLTNKLPEDAVALTGTEQDLAVRALGLDAGQTGAMYKTSATFSKNFECFAYPCYNIFTEEKLYDSRGTILGYKTIDGRQVIFKDADGKIKQTLELVKDPNELELVRNILNYHPTVEYRSAFWKMWEEMSSSLQPIYVSDYGDDDDDRKKKNSVF